VNTYYWIIAVLVVISVVGFVLAARAARAVPEFVKRRREELKKKLETEKKSWKSHLFSMFGHYLWTGIPLIIGSVRLVYRRWKTAPPGSPEQLEWGLLLAAIIAIPIWGLIWLADRWINHPRLHNPDAGISPVSVLEQGTPAARRRARMVQTKVKTP
jgi:hypothetical protein